jgi:hypothetical protein
MKTQEANKAAVLVALTGFRESGKSTARAYLEKKGFVSVRCKEVLLNVMRNTYPETLSLLAQKYNMTVDELLEKKPSEEVVVLMQQVGDVERQRDMWVFAKEYGRRASLVLNYSNVVTDDVRFHNEESIVRDLDGVIIRINRKGKNGKGKDGRIPRTEQDIPDIRADYIVDNNGTEKELYQQLDLILKDICK